MEGHGAWMSGTQQREQEFSYLARHVGHQKRKKHDTRKIGRQTGGRIRRRRVAMSELEDIHNSERLPDGMVKADRRGPFGMEENARWSSEKSMRKMVRATQHAVSGSAI